MIEIEYIVKDRRGVERLRTADKKAADADDRILENAERLAQWLRADQVLPNLPEPDLENLTIYLARHAREVEQMLKGKPVEREPSTEPESEPAPESLPEKVAPLKAMRG
ncbi:YebG family protein [uncultured Thiocystis sp.]|jgi:dsDNA-binding SOS-regulon protein|uniref:YebG family protein n=1 Tax=uncultured Thiocystis sp. TaxID=1202134 RepID=UPI0025EDE3C1|nr:YebG family protein [uncultured Thiocystis sp.]